MSYDSEGTTLVGIRQAAVPSTTPPARRPRAALVSCTCQGMKAVIITGTRQLASSSLDHEIWQQAEHTALPRSEILELCLQTVEASAVLTRCETASLRLSVICCLRTSTWICLII
ncbi:hypothetical protein Q8A73_009578 [Channa argus]|nr:hypothetical protein Q8A73_009578 [Channa argus]